MDHDDSLQSDSAEERILVAAPTGADSTLLKRVLGENGLLAESCEDLGDLLRRAREGVGVMVIAEEALDPAHADDFQDLLVCQEPWSEIPLLVLAGSGDVHRSRFRAQDIFGNWGNVTYLERPMRTVVLYSTLVGALRARRRQYQVRDLLGQVGDLLFQRESLLASIRDGFFALDASLRFTYVNEKAAELLGMRRDEMLRRRIWDLPEAALGPQFRIQFTRAAASGRPASFEEHHAGSGRWCEYRTYPAPDGLSVFVADVTARKRDEETLRENEERLRQYQKLEAMGKLAGGIAHDFNNILTAINGYSDLLLGREDWPEGFNRQALEEIRKAGERAAGLTRQLLAYSRKQVMTLKHLDLNEIVRDMTGILSRLLPENIRLDVRLSRESLPIRADGTRIEQVIMNLVLNARDAMPSGGALTVRTARKPASAGDGPLRKPGDAAVPSAAKPELGWASLEVRDTGTGMDAETMSRIFEPFFTTKGQGKGTGLGLSTVFGIVDQLGGQVRVDSAPDKGAAFEVLLRVSDARVESAGAQKDKVQGGYGNGRETIMVAEDEPSVRLFVERILASRGYSVILATDGMDALRLSRECREEIHMLLTDVVMPRLGGRELSERILAERPGLRVLFMSGHTDDALLGHGVLDGQAHFLQKPFNTEALLAKVGEVLGHETAGKPPAGSLRGEPPPGSLANSSNSAIP
jgi:PAS domain S-box-containing protein